jgi:hypothetical protein
MIHEQKGILMNQRSVLFRRSGIFYCEDTATGRQLSLRTRSEAEAHSLLHAEIESCRQPVFSLQLARIYLNRASAGNKGLDLGRLLKTATTASPKEISAVMPVLHLR